MVECVVARCCIAVARARSRKLEITSEHLRADGVVGRCIGSERVDGDLLPHGRVKQRPVQRSRELHAALRPREKLQ